MRFAASEFEVLDIANILEVAAPMHLAVTYDTNGFVKMYKNGALVQEGTIGITPSNVPWAITPNYYMGASNWNIDAEPASDMTFQHVKFWEEVLSGAQIQELYQLDFS